MSLSFPLSIILWTTPRTTVRPGGGPRCVRRGDYGVSDQEVRTSGVPVPTRCLRPMTGLGRRFGRDASWRRPSGGSASAAARGCASMTSRGAWPPKHDGLLLVRLYRVCRTVPVCQRRRFVIRKEGAGSIPSPFDGEGRYPPASIRDRRWHGGCRGDDPPASWAVTMKQA